MNRSTCGICGNSDDNKIISVKEMAFGKRDAFNYVECHSCGSLQIEEIPQNLGDYYPKDYYSFKKVEEYPLGKLKRILKSKRAGYYLNNRNLIGYILARLTPGSDCYKWLRLRNPSERILDVGCGAGNLLLQLRNEGFGNAKGSNLIGIDPYIESDIQYKNGVRIFKNTIDNIPGTFDYIMMHHSFEHMEDPKNVLMKINRSLMPNGMLLIRIPCASSFAYRNYGVNWVQIDAPRHIYLHTEKGITLLARDAGFAIDEIIYDSTAFQFWGSEQYMRDIPLHDPRSYIVNRQTSLFSQEEIRDFEIRAKELNEIGDGDSACFFLRKISNI